MKKAKIFSLGILIIFGCTKKTPKTEPSPPSPIITKPTQVVETAFAFPGADGFGKNTTGGRGGRVIKVTNLNDAGAGSLREAINTTGPRIIVFDVSGNIVLRSRLQINSGDVTIAGQTAPGDGICIQNYEMNVNASNVIIRFMRFRMGDITKNEQDALWGRYQQNLIIDHCSMSWSIDECSSFYANKEFTMQWCILSESLNKSFHEKDDHSYGGIWGGVNASFHHNLLAHHNSRNVRFDGGKRSGTGISPFGIDKVDYRNNVIYNWGANSAYGGENGEYNIVNNYYKAGPGTSSSRRFRIMEISMASNLAIYGPGFGKFFIDGNHVEGSTSITTNNWAGGVDQGSGLGSANYNLSRQLIAFNADPLTPRTAIQAYEAVLLYGGASYKRDLVDTRIINEVKTGTTTFVGSKTGKKGIIDSQTDVGGWPILQQTPPLKDTDGDGMPDDWEVANKLDPNKANSNARDLSTAYDNIEVYINSLVKSITDNQYK